jgi:hypothetical protein
MQLLHHHLLHAIIASLHGRDRVLGLLHRFLLNDRRHHLRWCHTAQGVKRHHLFMLIDATVLDDASESPRLQLHFHQKCSIRVIGLYEGG